MIDVLGHKCHAALRFFLVTLLGFASVAAADSSLDRQFHPRIVNGSPIVSSGSSVVEVRERYEGELYLCSGSIIAPKVVLTAFHCVSDSADKMSVVIDGKVFKVDRIKTSARTRGLSSGLIKDDIALLFLKKPTTKPRLSLLVSRIPQPNDQISIFGYGQDEVGGIGVLKGGTANVYRLSSGFLITVFSSLLQANTCGGDSGGPAIMSYTDSNGRTRTGIVGTVSAGTSDDCWIGDKTYFINTQASSVLNFIKQNVRGLRLE